MKLENQVCALDQAMRLKQLGVAQTGLYWTRQFDGYTDTEQADWRLTEPAY